MRGKETTLRIASDPAHGDEIDRGIKVGTAAQIIGCDPSYVRKLLRRGDLAGYHLQRGVRVWLSSVRAFQTRRPTRCTHATAAPDTPKPGAPYREAVAALHGLGLRFVP